ncbi:hypothetical protein [Bdellovibrio sp. HCB-110]|uniref:hypothetical protein n=1 Tax=Bdellovibrio sp. HCB-110 TaxID=3391182 RepID=UPI0039B580F3
MKSLVMGLFLSVFFISSASWAGRGYLYEANFNHMGDSYLDRLESMPTDQLSSLANDKRNICIHRYRGILDDGVLDIRIALGYFDWTTGNNVYAGHTNYGLSPSMDLGAYSALKRLLLTPCYGKARFCGFRQDPKNSYRFLREVQIHGNKYNARVEIHFSSATEYLNANLVDYRTEQKQRTQFMENYFARALQEADAVFYFGHSRNGGGPDFAPPIFIPGRNKVNYDGYYEVQRPGLKKMISALNNGSKKTAVIGLMSCASRDHFLSRVRAAAPKTGVITSMDVLNVDEVYTAMIGGADALLRGQCQRSFYQQLRMTHNNQKFITMDGMFE